MSDQCQLKGFYNWYPQQQNYKQYRTFVCNEQNELWTEAKMISCINYGFKRKQNLKVVVNLKVKLWTQFKQF